MLRTIAALIQREMATTYGRSALGYVWAILEPLAGILLLTFVFSLAFKAPGLGNSFPLFYASGFLPFVMYLDVSNKISVALRFSKPLLFYPGVRYVDAILARFILNSLTQISILCLILPAILAFYPNQAVLDVPAILNSVAAALVLALGIGTMNAFLIAISPGWERIWAVLNRPMFIISAIFFTFESIPQPYRDILWYNPLIHVVGMMRTGFYSYYDATYVSLTYVYGLGLGLTALGLLFLNRHARDIINS